MSDIIKIKEEYLNKLKDNLDLNAVNQLKSELFGKNGMLISGNKKENSTELFDSKQTNSQKPFLNFFIERYNDAYNIQLKELISLHKNKIKSRSTFEDGYFALKLANAAYKSLKLKKTIKI